MIRYGPTPEKVKMQRQTNWLKHTDLTELKKITIRIYSLFEFFFFVFKSLNFVAIRYV